MINKAKYKLIQKYGCVQTVYKNVLQVGGDEGSFSTTKELTDYVKANNIPLLTDKPYEVIPEYSYLQEWIDSLPDWEQPEGAHDALPEGYICKYNGEIWESTIDDNVWEPEITPAYLWIKIMSLNPVDETDLCGTAPEWNEDQHWNTYFEGEFYRRGSKIYKVINKAWCYIPPDDPANGHLGWEFVKDCEPTSDPEDDLCSTSPAWTASIWVTLKVGETVTHDNAVWEAINTTYTWIAPAKTGDGAISWIHVKDCN